MHRRSLFLSLLPTLAGSESAITKEAVLRLVNQSRVKARCKALTVNPAMAKAAQARADHMKANGYFGHNTPDGRSPWTFLAAVGYQYSHVGENLAEGFPSAARQHDYWMRSPGHRENILNPAFTETGIGIVESRHGTIVVELFASPAA